MSMQMDEGFGERNRFNRRMHQWDQLPELTRELRAMIGDPSSSPAPGEGGGRSGAPGSRAPWNQRAANMFFAIHAEIRRTESMLTIALHHRAVYRGGSDAMTFDVLDRLPILLEEFFERDPASEILDEALGMLVALTRQARVVIDPDERRTRAPWVRCHLCEGDLWIYAEGQEVNPRLDSEHFVPGAAYCNACGVFYPRDIWERVAKELADVA